jgi:hypothetical protein
MPSSEQITAVQNLLDAIHNGTPASQLQRLGLNSISLRVKHIANRTQVDEQVVRQIAVDYGYIIYGVGDESE